MRIGLEFLRPSVDRPPARLIAEEDPGQSIRNFPGHLEQVHQVARASRTLDLEVIAVIEVERQQGANQQRVHRHPYGTTPVRVSTEHACVRFGRKIVHAVFLAVHIEDIRMVGVVAGERPYPIRTQEFILIEHARQNSAQPFRINQRNDAAVRHTRDGPVRSDECSREVRASVRKRSVITSVTCGTSSRCHGSMTVVAQRGNKPTMERTLSRVALPSGRRRTS